VLERLATVAPKVCELLEEAEEDLIAFYAFPAEHRPKLRSTNPLERSTPRDRPSRRRSSASSLTMPR
jgi:transposase-like protein